MVEQSRLIYHPNCCPNLLQWGLLHSMNAKIATPEEYKYINLGGYEGTSYLYRSQKCNAISPTAAPLTITLAPDSATDLMSSSTFVSSVFA